MTDLTTTLDPRLLRDAFGSYPTGVVAVAARVGDELVGLAASSFTSVSLEPALVSFSVATTSRTWPRLREAGALGVSVLADHHDAVCRQLAGPADERFEGLALAATPQGAVVLDEAVTHFVCRVHAEVEAGDHVVVLLAVDAVTDTAGGSPLVFHRSGFAKLHRDDLDPSRLDGRINGQELATGGAPGAAEDAA